ncbi:hypothetical protein ACQ5SO_11900 [Rhodovulum sp. DZ06]|uniref:hypothetical protein n=1 Tax=Rhodovulum sp. DZ06 TaxID=3425126 RepID=UPI003D34260A
MARPRPARLPRWSGVGPVPAGMRGGALMLGDFDGLHLGRRRLLSLLRGAASSCGGDAPGPRGAPFAPPFAPGGSPGGPRGAPPLAPPFAPPLAPCGIPLGAMTAEPHPRAFFAPGGPPFRLTCGAARDLVFAEAGLGMLYTPRFDRAFAALAPETFFEEILVGALGVRALVFGEDFRFGARRAGDAALLARLGARHGVLTVAAPELRADGARVSSSRIREAVRDGDLAGAAALLGRPWRTGVERLGPGRVRFDRDQFLPPPGLHEVDALDAAGAPLARTVIAVGPGRSARCAAPPGTAALRWR